MGLRKSNIRFYDGPSQIEIAERQYIEADEARIRRGEIPLITDGELVLNPRGPRDPQDGGDAAGLYVCPGCGSVIRYGDSWLAPVHYRVCSNCRRKHA